MKVKILFVLAFILGALMGGFYSHKAANIKYNKKLRCLADHSCKDYLNLNDIDLRIR